MPRRTQSEIPKMIFTTRTFSVFLPIVVSLLSCGNSPRVDTPLDDSTYRFDFTAPDLELELPGRLREISGLTMISDSLVGAIEDEKGVIYLINTNSGEVVNEFKFGKKGDYEGVELVDDTMYVLRSNGDIYMVADWRSEDPHTSRIRTYLDRKNDPEGLGYQAEHHRLLIAAKESPGKGRPRVRSIFGFDLFRKELDPEPAYMIPLDTVGVRLGLPGEWIRTLLAPILDLEGFKPSALAVHPLTGDIFVISSVLKAIAVLNPAGKLTALIPVEVDGMPQPEGLAFLSTGDILISTEGRGGKGKIFRFNQRRLSE